MISIAPPVVWNLAQAARVWGVKRQRVSLLVNTGRVPAAYRDPWGAWRIPAGTPKPAPREAGRPRRQRAA